MAKEKSPQKASELFHSIMKASVKGNPKPSIEIVEAERFHRRGQDYIILVIKNGNKYIGESYALEGKYIAKKGETVADILTACKQGIDI